MICRLRSTTVIALLTAVLLVLAACAGSSDDATAVTDAQPTAAPATTDEPAEAEPTAEPEPTATPEPEPTATLEPEPEPTAVPEPERDFAPVAAAIEDFIAAEELEGASLVIVHADEGVIYDEQFGGFSPGRISMIASSSKMMSAGVLVSLAQDGVLDLDAPLTEAVPFAGDHPDLLPVQLVSNSSGLVGLGPDILYAPYLCQWLPGQTLSECGEQVLSTPADDGDIVAPDTEFRYGGAQWQVAGAVAETVSGKSWAELIDEIYVQPCNLESTGFANIMAVGGGALGYPAGFEGDPTIHEPAGNPSIEGGAYSSPDDYAKLLLMHLRGGECENGQVFTQASLDLMHTDRIVSYDGDAGEDTGYGMGWWVDRETGILSDGGAWGTLPWLNLEDGYGAYWVIEDDFTTTGKFSDDLIDAVHLAVTGTELT